MSFFELYYENTIHSNTPISLDVLKSKQGYTSINNHRYKSEVDSDKGKFRRTRTFIEQHKSRPPLVYVEIRRERDVFLSARVKLIIPLIYILFSLIFIVFALTIISEFIEFIPIGIVTIVLNAVAFYTCRIGFEMNIREFEKDFMQEFNIKNVTKRGICRVLILNRVL